MMAILKEERIGNQRLLLGDCLAIMPGLGRFDAVVTDPPYGVNLGSDPTHVIGNKPYSSFDDTPFNVANAVVPAVELAKSISDRAVVTPGTRCAWLYPPPDEMGAIYFPAGAGFSRWGFTCSQPILFYGKDPYMPRNKKPNSVQCTENSPKNGHPCPKPDGLMRWIIGRSSLPGDTILDPFMGSGTTLVACQRMGRAGTGIELDPDYFDIACRRVDEAARQPDLLIPETRPAPVQESLI